MSDRLDQVQRAIDLMATDRFSEAEAICRNLLKRSPANAHAARVLSNVLFLQGEMVQASHFARVAARHAPAGDAMFTWSLARVCRQFDEPAFVISLLNKSTATNPRFFDAWIALSEVLLSQNRFAEALEAADAGLRAEPGQCDARFNRAIALMNMGRGEEALAEARAVAGDSPDYPGRHILFISVANYTDAVDPNEIKLEHEACARWLDSRAEARGGALPPVEPRSIAPTDRIRVGLLSPDLREHPVGWFIDAAVRGLDKRRFHLTAYSNTARPDARSERLKGLVDAWRDIALLAPRTAAEVIRQDAIDVLIELAGYTAGNGMEIVAFQPAPRQVSYLGYPNTTGSQRVHYRLVDTRTDPPGHEGLSTERLVRLDPCFVCYTPPATAPITPGPAAAAGRIVFGSFNALKKTNNRLLALWSEILRRVPDSALIIKNPALRDQGTRDGLLKRLQDLGVPADRVELLAPTETLQQHLATYARVDIALDTFPYHGTTTTCEALYMGVPVITRVGNHHAARVGLSLLSAVGLEAFCADSDEAYIDAAVKLAQDHHQLAELRRTLRPRLLASPVCDAKAYAARLAAALEQIAAGT
jgi:predicted O-linked N-acetylglucosamine transferase (SPINDLY family)